MKILIVGGVAGGASAAARLRRLSEKDEIIMFEKGEYISFANCGLPYYVGEVIQNRNKLLVQTVEGMGTRFNLDIRNWTEIIQINRETKTVTARKVATGEEYTETYDVLILSPGASPIKPRIEGIEQANNVYTLRNIPDTDRIKEKVDREKPEKAVVIGGGFIGLEIAENLRERGVDVTIVDKSSQVMAPIDFEMAQIVHAHLREKGVHLLLEENVSAILDAGKKVRLESGKELDADMILLAIGVKPESQIAKEAGLDVGVNGAIKVNEHMQTSDPSIYAVGDVIEVKDYIHGTDTYIPLAWPANRQGRLVADHIHGKEAVYHGTLGTSIAKVFDLSVASTGSNEKILKRQGVPYEVVHVTPNSHAGYYPGAAQLNLKLIFDKETGRIYGAQAVGKDGVDKRIDVIATAIKGNMTVIDLPDIEIAYAPPYSSAKDPVNMAGYAAVNIMEGMAETVQWHEID
ncbi:CoA-disulfide reductase, partial [Pradoshia sp.]